MTYHSIYLRRFRPKTAFVLTTKPRWKLLSSAVCTIKVFINLTLYLSSNFYERIEFLKIFSDYILFICVVPNQNRIFVFLCKPRWKLLCSAVSSSIYQPYNVFIFEFLYENQISQKSFRIHSIYLYLNCVFIKKS